MTESVKWYNPFKGKFKEPHMNRQIKNVEMNCQIDTKCPTQWAIINCICEDSIPLYFNGQESFALLSVCTTYRHSIMCFLPFQKSFKFFPDILWTFSVLF